MQTQRADVGKAEMKAKRAALLIVSLVLLAIGFIGLFPFTAIALVGNLFGDYTVGLSINIQSRLAAIGGASAVAAIWAFSSALRVAQ
jgi:hypothetical protein